MNCKETGDQKAGAKETGDGDVSSRPDHPAGVSGADAQAVRSLPFNRYLLFTALAAGGCLLDLVSKHWAFVSFGMPGEKTEWLIDGVFAMQTSLNEGALFGLGQGGVQWFALFSLIALAAIVYWLFVRKAARDILLTASLGCITAGIFGNLYDRLGLHGLKWNYANQLHEVGEPVYAVRDWILVMIGNWPWPNFNIADSLLVLGVGILLIHGLFFDEKKRVESTATNG